MGDIPNKGRAPQELAIRCMVHCPIQIDLGLHFFHIAYVSFIYHLESDWLVVWNINFVFPEILGMSNHPLIDFHSMIFQRGDPGPPTSRGWWSWQFLPPILLGAWLMISFNRRMEIKCGTTKNPSLVFEGCSSTIFPNVIQCHFGKLKACNT